MEDEGWGNGGAVEIQGFTASKFLPHLTQDESLLGGRYAGPPGNRMSPVVLRLAMNAGGTGGWRRDFGIATGLGFWTLADV